MSEKKNVVLIVIDALRPDHLSCYGYHKNTSPNIDYLAKNGIIFENAFSTTNVTDPSITTILSGLYPISHGIRNHGEKVTRSMIRTFYKRKVLYLSEILKKYGYYTIGLDWLGRWHKKGFDYYLGEHLQLKTLKFFSRILRIIPNVISKKIKELCAKFLKRKKGRILIPTASDLTNIATMILENINEPFFLFIHYWDTHTPYYAPAEIYNVFKPNKKSIMLKELFRNIKNNKWRRYLLEAFKGLNTVDEAIAMYDAAIRYVDQEIGRLIKCLKSLGIFRDTIFVITSDHGESLTEHKIFFDHHGLYDVSIHVPLIFSNLPIKSKEKRIKGLIQHTDILPTILDVLNMPFEKTQFNGVSLVPLIRGEIKSVRSFIVAEEFYTERKIAIRTNKWKYIYSPSEKHAICRYCGIIHGGLEELYDLENDPNETQNIIKEKPEITIKLRTLLFEFIGQFKQTKSKRKKIEKIIKKIRREINLSAHGI